LFVKKKQASRNSQVFKIQLDKKKKIALEIRIQREAYKKQRKFALNCLPLEIRKMSRYGLANEQSLMLGRRKERKRVCKD
jgi:hypothetical protein